LIFLRRLSLGTIKSYKPNTRLIVFCCCSNMWKPLLCNINIQRSKTLRFSPFCALYERISFQCPRTKRFFFFIYGGNGVYSFPYLLPHVSINFPIGPLSSWPSLLKTPLEIPGFTAYFLNCQK
jgi:hypothetical protein